MPGAGSKKHKIPPYPPLVKGGKGGFSYRLQELLLDKALPLGAWVAKKEKEERAEVNFMIPAAEV
jgi:hypothetical protein